MTPTRATVERELAAVAAELDAMIAALTIGDTWALTLGVEHLDGRLPQPQLLERLAQERAQVAA